ncbi:MAG: hypothetical protein H0V27_07270 [Pyrinomonadaceae bacterium]|jgi:hypothetical protein|nr:hypothetical protein [Pyrinomonadaceae bacterium]
MDKDTNFANWLYDSLSKPYFVLFVISLYNFLAVPARYGGLCFHNWDQNLGLAFLLLVAASALWFGRWWSCSAAGILSGKMIFDFMGESLKVFGFLSKKATYEDKWLTPENWIGFYKNHPAELMQVFLAAGIFCFAVLYLARLMHTERGSQVR